MEADQFGVLFMSVVASIEGMVGSWILLLPAYRYLYVLVLAPFDLVEAGPRPTGNNRRAKLICLVTVLALLSILCPLTPDAMGWYAGAVAVVALGFSFAADAISVLMRQVGRWESA